MPSVPKPQARKRGRDTALLHSLAQAYRNADYLAFLRKQFCLVCHRGGSEREPVTASHIGRSYHGLKNHDWLAVPMCGKHHYIWEYYRESEYIPKNYPMPTIAVCEGYFQKYLLQSGREDDRRPEQLKPI